MLLSAVLISTDSFSQTGVNEVPKKQMEIGLEGMIGVSYGSNTVGINVGGPSLKFRINKFKVGVGCFPSLIVVNDKAFPKLAVSPIGEYHKVMLIAPYYGYDSKNKMIWIFGVGYEFQYIV